MDILEFGECFPDTGSIFTIVVYKENDRVYTARANDRCASKFDIKPESLQDVVAIEKTAFQPQYPESFMQAKANSQVHIKRPSLIAYHHIDDIKNDRIANDLMREAQICEMLRIQPHNNIAEYLGCQVESGRISGLCFTSYQESLMQRLNPGHLSKRDFTNSPCHDDQWCSVILEGVKKGLDHLHALGLVHNDLNPSNIMLAQEDTPKIIDFGSCRFVGESLKDVGRTYEWYDDKVDTASQANDLEALAEIRTWMFGKIGDFRFDG